ncbi:MAG: YceD family protein [Chloroflexota bacterium]|nr:YceD family protein [Chloroflexota bacterium]
MTAEGRAAGTPVRRSNSLLFNVSTLLQEPIGSLRHYELESARANGLDSDVHGSLKLLRTDQSVLATAALTTTLSDTCGSCLEEVELFLELAFDEEFWPSMDLVSGLSIEPPPERAGFSVIDGQIDLMEAVRQYVEMERPMSPRCGTDCPGLDTSTSTEAPVDDRWSALSALKLELKGD